MRMSKEQFLAEVQKAKEPWLLRPGFFWSEAIRSGSNGNCEAMAGEPGNSQTYCLCPIVVVAMKKKVKLHGGYQNIGAAMGMSKRLVRDILRVADNNEPTPLRRALLKACGLA